LTRNEIFLIAAVEPFDVKLHLRRNASITEVLSVFKPQRALTAQILGAAQSALVLLKPSIDVSRNSCVQAAVSAADNVKTVAAVIHPAVSGVATRQRVSKYTKCTGFNTRAILRCVGKRQDNS